jgi:hypothetical protein
MELFDIGLDVLCIRASQPVYFTHHIIHLGFPAYKLNLYGTAIIFDFHGTLLFKDHTPANTPFFLCRLMS